MFLTAHDVQRIILKNRYSPYLYFRARKTVKMTEIEKNGSQVLKEVGYNQSDLKVSDLNSEVFSRRLRCYLWGMIYARLMIGVLTIQ